MSHNLGGAGLLKVLCKHMIGLLSVQFFQLKPLLSKSSVQRFLHGDVERRKSGGFISEPTSKECEHGIAIAICVSSNAITAWVFELNLGSG